jgi:hypothetical protein
MTQLIYNKNNEPWLIAAFQIEQDFSISVTKLIRRLEKKNFRIPPHLAPISQDS